MTDLTLTPTPELSIMVRQMLTHPEGHPWSLQGFGMLRCDLMGRDYRLHIWDRRFRTQDVATLHDHPWDLESLVLSGQITNVIYDDLGHKQHDADNTHWRNVIQPGRESAQIQPPMKVKLTERSREVYRAGQGYAQDAADVHDSIYLTGTVTLARRTNRQVEGTSGDKAKVYWPMGGLDHWVDARPQKATPKKVRAICDVALAMWGELEGAS